MIRATGLSRWRSGDPRGALLLLQLLAEGDGSGGWRRSIKGTSIWRRTNHGTLSNRCASRIKRDWGEGKEWGVLVTPVGAPLAGGGGGTASSIPGGLAALGLGIQRGDTEGVEGFKREGTGATNSNEIMSDLDKQHGRIRSLEVEGL